MTAKYSLTFILSYLLSTFFLSPLSSIVTAALATSLVTSIGDKRYLLALNIILTPLSSSALINPNNNNLLSREGYFTYCDGNNICNQTGYVRTYDSVGQDLTFTDGTKEVVYYFKDKKLIAVSVDNHVLETGRNYDYKIGPSGGYIKNNANGTVRTINKTTVRLLSAGN